MFHANKLIATTERLRVQLGRAPGEEEIRRQLEVSRETLLDHVPCPAGNIPLGPPCPVDCSPVECRGSGCTGAVAAAA